MHPHRHEPQLANVPFTQVCDMTHSYVCHDSFLRGPRPIVMTHASTQAGALARPCLVHKYVQQKTLFVHFGTWMMQVPVLQRVAVSYSVLYCVVACSNLAL